MSVLLKKLLWWRNQDRKIDSNGTFTYENPENITDSLDMTVGRGLDIKNNVVVFNLKNPAKRFDVNGNVIHKFVDSTFKIKFEEQDQIKLYLKYTDDMADVEDSAWADNVEEPSDSYLKGVYYVIEYKVKTTDKGTPIQIKCADKTYILFNRLLVEDIAASEGLTTPQVIQKVVRFSSQNPHGQYSGTGADAGARYDVDAQLDDSESGYIQEARRATTEDGSVNADLTFPVAALAKVWKPVYEWINDLSQIEYINTVAETAGTIVYGKPFIFYVDENNKFHWIEQSTTADETINIGITSTIYEYNLDNKVFDTINMIIFRGGEDLYGNGTLNYEVDTTTNVKEMKMRVVAMTDIAVDLIEKEKAAGNLTQDNATPGAFTFSGNFYGRTGGAAVTAVWNNTSYASDATYNTAMRTEIVRLGRIRARKLIQGLTGARLKGSITRKGTIVVPGSLLLVTNTLTGQDKELIRVQDVSDTINKSGWTTTMRIEQDSEAIIGSS